MSKEYYLGTGRRKTSVARVRLSSGKGIFIVNNRTVDEYFPRTVLVKYLKTPLVATDTIGNYDINVSVNGGGLTGQAGAIRLGIARALLNINRELRPVLKREGFLTRDARKVERKKYGLKKARRAPQFSKR
ncbi:30S ribosomal protein S9 [bacterium]|nr:30S ribosomal protein S9 [bacterium]